MNSLMNSFSMPKTSRRRRVDAGEGVVSLPLNAFCSSSLISAAWEEQEQGEDRFCEKMNFVLTVRKSIVLDGSYEAVGDVDERLETLIVVLGFAFGRRRFRKRRKNEFLARVCCRRVRELKNEDQGGDEHAR